MRELNSPGENAEPDHLKVSLNAINKITATIAIITRIGSIHHLFQRSKNYLQLADFKASCIS
jgi:hypothetical protein